MMGSLPPQANATHRGFTLVEVVVVLIIVSVLISMAAVMTRGVVAAQKRTITATRIAGLDAALAQFASQQKRLPCPADGTKDSGANNVGTEGNRNANSGCSTNQQDGVVPWRTLGLTETDATDGWGRRFTYRVGPLLAADSGMDLSWCDSAGSGVPTGTASLCDSSGGCTSATPSLCTSVLKFLTRNSTAPGKGLMVKDISHQVLMNPTPAAGEPHTGAAYVLISAGETGGGAYLPSGVRGDSIVTDGTEEALNYADRAFTAGTTYYVDDSLVETSGTGHFDDVISRPTILAVAARAGLGPRAH